MVGCRDQAWTLLLGQLSCLKSNKFRFFCKELIGMSMVISEREGAGVKFLMPL